MKPDREVGMKKIRNVALDVLLEYLSHNPMDRLPAMITLGHRLDRGHTHKQLLDTLETLLTNPQGIWYRFTETLFKEVTLHSLQKFVECFVCHASLDRRAIARDLEQRYQCGIPWAILMDPTSLCNLQCIGCWAAHYGNAHSLSFQTMDSIIAQGKELGTHFYIFSGGEPLLRKHDIIALCEKHQDCYFLSFTNGTLVDDQLCLDISRVGNLSLAFSIEGNETATDMRRGTGTYHKVVQAMQLMHAHRQLYGYSTCYHRYNTDSVGSDEFVDEMIDNGCRFAWNFTYIPVGNDASADMLATAQQRSYMYRRIREIRNTKPIFALDFWNDGEFTNGCIGAGRSYLHINSAGEVEPCAFIHYSNVNIHDSSLLDALRSPLFAAYRKSQPFNQNHLQPCPLLDNPTCLQMMVKTSNARSTEIESPEDVEHLCAKTTKAAQQWAPVARRLWGRDTHVQVK